MAEFNPDEYLKADVFDPDAFLASGVSQPSANNQDVPTTEALAAEQSRVDAIPERTLGEKVEGIGEAALTTLTGATGGALGFAAGSIEGAAKNLMGDLTQDEAMQIAQQRASDYTYEPRGEAGQEYVGEIGEALSSLPPVVGATPVNIPKGLGNNAKAFSSINSPLAKKIAQESTGDTRKNFTKKLDSERFTPRIRNMVEKANKQGFDEGMTKVIANASPIDKRRMRQQVSVMEKGMKDPLYQAKNRPADIAGESLLKQVDFVKSNNNKAGVQLNRVANSLKGKEVDINEPVARFIDDVQELGVSFDENGKPNFSGSQIEGVAPAETLITKILSRIERKQDPDAFEAHNFKKFIDENVNFGKSAEGLGGKTERVAKSFRKGINDSIGGRYDKYKEANTRFSDTVQALDSLQDAAGKKLDFFGPNSDKAVGTVLRRLMSNAQGRVTLMDAIENINSTSKKYGGSFDDDILTQMLFADELDAVFGGGARTSLKGEVKKANIESAIDLSQMTAAGATAAAAKAGVNKLRGINEKNQLKSIKALLMADPNK